MMDLVLGEVLGSFLTPGGKDLVGMMVVMVMVMVMAAAGAVLIMFVVMMVLVLMIVVVIVFLMVMMVMAGTLRIVTLIVIVVVFMLMVMMMLMFLMVVMVVAGAIGIIALVLVVMIVVMMMVSVFGFVSLMLLPHLGQQLIRQGDLLNGREDRLAVQIIPGSGQDGGIRIFGPQHGDSGFQLLLRYLLGTGEDDGAGGFDLIVIELAEVLHVHLHLGGVRHGDEAVQLHVLGLGGGVFHGHDDVAELTDAGGLDQDAVRGKLLLHVLEGLVEVTHQRAADAACGHFGDLHAGVLQKTTVNVDLAELIFNEDQLFAGESLGQQLLDEGSLAGP